MDAPGKTLLQVSCTTSNGMTGGLMTLTVTRSGGERVRVCSEGRLSARKEMSTRRWEDSWELMELLLAFLEESRWEEWDALPPPVGMADGTRQSVEVRLTDGSRRCLTAGQGDPQAFQKLYQAILATAARGGAKDTAPAVWSCPRCMTENQRNFCTNCGAPRPS